MRKSQPVLPWHWTFAFGCAGVVHTPVCKPENVDLCLCLSNSDGLGWVGLFVLSALTLTEFEKSVPLF